MTIEAPPFRFGPLVTEVDIVRDLQRLETHLEVLRRSDDPAGDLTLMHQGSGSPEGVVVAPVGHFYLRSDGSISTTLYVKQSGAGNTGWSPLLADNDDTVLREG